MLAVQKYKLLADLEEIKSHPVLHSEQQQVLYTTHTVQYTALVHYLYQLLNCLFIITTDKPPQTCGFIQSLYSIYTYISLLILANHLYSIYRTELGVILKLLYTISTFLFTVLNHSCLLGYIWHQ